MKSKHSSKFAKKRFPISVLTQQSVLGNKNNIVGVFKHAIAFNLANNSGFPRECKSPPYDLEGVAKVQRCHFPERHPGSHRG